MNTSTAETRERFSVTVLSLVLVATNVGFLYLVDHHTDVLGQIFY